MALHTTLLVCFQASFSLRLHANSFIKVYIIFRFRCLSNHKKELTVGKFHLLYIDSPSNLKYRYKIETHSKQNLFRKFKEQVLFNIYISFLKYTY